MYYIFERFCIPMFRDFTSDYVTPRRIIVSIFGCILPGTLVLFIGKVYSVFAVVEVWLEWWPVASVTLSVWLSASVLTLEFRCTLYGRPALSRGQKAMWLSHQITQVSVGWCSCWPVTVLLLQRFSPSFIHGSMRLLRCCVLPIVCSTKYVSCQCCCYFQQWISELHKSAYLTFLLYVLNTTLNTSTVQVFRFFY